jgi:hypothetical protein
MWLEQPWFIQNVVDKMGYDTTFLCIEEISFTIYLKKENNAGLMLKFECGCSNHINISSISKPTGLEQVN